MARNFEMIFDIGGNLSSSFSGAFNKARNGLNDLGRQSTDTQRELNRLGNEFRRGKITQEQYSAETEKLTKNLKRLAAAQSGISGLKSQLGTGLNTVKTTASIATVGAAAAGTALAIKSMNVAGTFEQDIAKVGVVAGATAGDMQKLEENALSLGASTSKSASEVAVAMQDLAAKGMTSDEINVAMPGIIAASESSGEDLALTSSVVTSALNAFELEAGDASIVADVMAMSANKTAAGVEDLGYSFKYAAPIANTLGISMEELAASTGLMVDKGLTGEQAGTSLRMALTRLAKPTRQSQKALDELGFSAIDAGGNFKSLTEITTDWNKATDKLTEAQKVEYAATVFGTEAATGMINLFSTGADELSDMTKALEESGGAAEEAAKKMKDNYAGALDELKGSIESAQIKFASPMLPVFKDVFQGLSTTIDENLPAIEDAGRKVADSLSNILDPLSTTEPVMPTLTDAGGNSALFADMMAQYQKDLNKFNLFSPMDMGDKVVYMLDQAVIEIDTWMDGEGGEALNKIFEKTATIAATAYVDTMKNLTMSTGENLMEGNFMTALGTGSLVYMLGGGALLKGGINLGKTAYGMLGRNSTPTITSTTTNIPPTGRPTNPSDNPWNPWNPNGRSGNPTPTPTPTSTPTTGSTSRLATVGGKVSNILGKAALPVTLAVEGYNIVKSDDKVKTTTAAAGGLAGGWGGATAGAAAGTAIFPGIGTAVGAVLGGIAGSIGGHAVGGKAVDVARGSTGQTVQQTTIPVEQTTSRGTLRTVTTTTNPLASATVISNPPTTATATATSMPTEQQKTLMQQTVTETTSKIKTTAEQNILSLTKLNETTNQATDWISSLEKIESAGKKVTKSLKKLKKKIDNVEMPTFNTSNNSRVSYDE